MASRKRKVTQLETQKRWQETEVDYDCFASVKKVLLAVCYNES